MTLSIRSISIGNSTITLHPTSMDEGDITLDLTTLDEGARHDFRTENHYWMLTEMALAHLGIEAKVEYHPSVFTIDDRDE